MAFGLNWLKPELDKPLYWVHIVILALIVTWLAGLPFEAWPIIKLGLFIAIADTVAHTLLGLD